MGVVAHLDRAAAHPRVGDGHVLRGIICQVDEDHLEFVAQARPGAEELFDVLLIAGRERGRPQVGEHHDLRLHLPASVHEVRRGDDGMDEAVARSVARAELARPLGRHAREGGNASGLQFREHAGRLAGDDDGRLARRPDLAEQVAGFADGEIEDRDAGRTVRIEDGLVHARRGVEHDDQIPRGRRGVGRGKQAGHRQHQKREREQPQEELQRIDQFHRELVRPLVAGQQPQGGEVADRKLVLRD